MREREREREREGRGNRKGYEAVPTKRSTFFVFFSFFPFNDINLGWGGCVRGACFVSLLYISGYTMLVWDHTCD